MPGTTRKWKYGLRFNFTLTRIRRKSCMPSVT
jgi:hypothetical protein